MQEYFFVYHIIFLVFIIHYYLQKNFYFYKISNIIIKKIVIKNALLKYIIVFPLIDRKNKRYLNKSLLKKTIKKHLFPDVFLLSFYRKYA